MRSTHTTAREWPPLAAIRERKHSNEDPAQPKIKKIVCLKRRSKGCLGDQESVRESTFSIPSFQRASPCAETPSSSSLRSASTRHTQRVDCSAFIQAFYTQHVANRGLLHAGNHARGLAHTLPIYLHSSMGPPGRTITPISQMRRDGDSQLSQNSIQGY